MRVEGGYVWRRPLTFFALSFLIDFFEPVGNLLRIQGKLLRILQFAVQIEIFHKNTFFALPPPTLGSFALTPPLI